MSPALRARRRPPRWRAIRWAFAAAPPLLLLLLLGYSPLAAHAAEIVHHESPAMDIAPERPFGDDADRLRGNGAALPIDSREDTGVVALGDTHFGYEKENALAGDLRALRRAAAEPRGPGHEHRPHAASPAHPLVELLPQARVRAAAQRRTHSEGAREVGRREGGAVPLGRARRPALRLRPHPLPLGLQRPRGQRAHGQRTRLPARDARGAFPEGPAVAGEGAQGAQRPARRRRALPPVGAQQHGAGPGDGGAARGAGGAPRGAAAALRRRRAAAHLRQAVLHVQRLPHHAALLRVGIVGAAQGAHARLCRADGRISAAPGRERKTNHEELQTSTASKRSRNSPDQKIEISRLIVQCSIYP